MGQSDSPLFARRQGMADVPAGGGSFGSSGSDPAAAGAASVTSEGRQGSHGYGQGLPLLRGSSSPEHFADSSRQGFGNGRGLGCRQAQAANVRQGLAQQVGHLTPAGQRESRLPAPVAVALVLVHQLVKQRQQGGGSGARAGGIQLSQQQRGEHNGGGVLVHGRVQV